MAESERFFGQSAAATGAVEAGAPLPPYGKGKSEGEIGFKPHTGRN